MAIPDDEHVQQDPYEVIDPPQSPDSPSGLNQWLTVVTLVLVIVVAVAIGYMIHAQHAAQRLVSANGHLAAELTQTETQLTSLKAKISSLSATSAIQPALPADETWNGKAVTPVHRAGSRVIGVRRRPVVSKWQRKMQQQLSEQQRRILDAQQAIAKTQSDLASDSANTQTSLNGLNGSVAKDHAELVSLEKLGQRNYYEFDLLKSKRFAREGPLSLDLRHTNTKRQNYNVDLLVDDYKLVKKNVSLYEPIVLETAESPQPLELVVNRIGKNRIHGYISAPKSYGQRETASTAAVTTSSAAQPSAAVPVQTAATSGADPNASPQTMASASHK